MSDQRTMLSFLDRTGPTVIGLTSVLLAFTRSTAVAYFATGAICCALTAKTIKRVLKGSRPLAHAATRKTTYGMPSTHSTVITYYATYVTLACARLPIHKSLPSCPATRVLPTLIILPWAASVAMSRVWLGHHTWPQVAAGCSCGLAFASIWFALWKDGINTYGQTLEDTLDSFFGW